MSALTETISSASQAAHLRPFEVRRDLKPVADLVELCFSDSLDPEGQSYLRQMRAAASNPAYLRWSGIFDNRGFLPVHGYVWEEDGRVVGNLTLIPFFSLAHRFYLIANVAVHPEFRRRGIARSLTSAAVDHARQRGAQATWLQVRADNPAAVNLYQGLNFKERARRTSWQRRQDTLPNPAGQPEAVQSPGGQTRLQIVARRSGDWRLQRQWLAEAYPPEVRWHLPMRASALQPGLRGLIYRLFNELLVKHWSVLEGNRLLGILSWQSSLGYSDHLWLAVDPQAGEHVTRSLLEHASQRLSPRRPLTLDFPAGRLAEAIYSTGFQDHQTLIWMALDFT